MIPTPNTTKMNIDDQTTNALMSNANANANANTGNSESTNVVAGNSNTPPAGNSNTPAYDLLDPFQPKPRKMCVYTRQSNEWQREMLCAFGYDDRDLYLTKEFLESEHLSLETFPETFRRDHDQFFGGRYVYPAILTFRKVEAEIRELRIRFNAETEPEVKSKLGQEIETLSRAQSTKTKSGWQIEFEWDEFCPDLIWHADAAKKVYEQEVEATIQAAETPCQEWIMEQDPREPNFNRIMDCVSKDRGVHRISGFLALVLQTELGASLKIPVKFNKYQVHHIYQFLKTYSENHGHRVNIFGFPEHEFTETTLSVRVTYTQIDPDNMTPIEVLLRNMIRNGCTSYTIEFPNREKCVGRVMHFTSEWFKERELDKFCTVHRTYSEDKTQARLTFNMEDYEEHEQFVFNEEKDEYEIPKPICKYRLECGLVGCTKSHPVGFIPRAPRAPRAPLLTGGGSARNTTRAEAPLFTGGGSARNTTRAEAPRSETRAVPVPAPVPAPTCNKIGGGSSKTWNTAAAETDAAPVAIDTTRVSKAQERLTAIANTRVEQQAPRYCLQAGQVPPPVWDFTPESVCQYDGKCTNFNCVQVHLTERRKSNGVAVNGRNCSNPEQCTVQNCHLWHGAGVVAAVAPVCLSTGTMPPVTTGTVNQCRHGKNRDGSGCTAMKCTDLHLVPRFKSDGTPVTFNETCRFGRACKRADCHLLHPSA